jgi:hypothetical protein
MRKFYSLVLMATALLIGTNMQAVDVTDFAGLQDAITNASTTEQTIINVTADFEASSAIVISGNKNIVLNFQNNAEITKSSGYIFDIYDAHVSLTGKGGLVGAGAANNSVFIWLNGSTDSSVKDYCVLEIGKDVQITSQHNWALGVYPNNKHGYGVKVIVDGYVYGETGAVTINGTIQDVPGKNGVPEDAQVPTFVISSTGSMVAGKESASIYAAGYGRWIIEGNVEGGTGIYAKAGNITIQGKGTVTATATAYTPAVPDGDGYDGGMGCAIIQDSKNGYAGGMQLTVTGDATLTSEAEGGFAIQEIKTDASQSKTENIVIKSGTFNGNINTTAEVKENIVLNGTITGGTFNQDITEYLNNVTGVITPTENPDGSIVYVINEKPTTAGDWKTTIVGAAATDYVRMEDGSPVELSADAQAEYLVMQGTAKIIVPEGLKLTVKEIVMGKDAVIEVAAGGKLIVTGAQGIVSNHASNLVLHTSESAQATFLLNPAVISNKNPKATVEFVTKSFMKDGVNVFQRFGIPTYTALESMECSDPSIRTRVWEYSAATDSWQEFGNLGSFDIHQLNVPFAGYNMISYRETPGLVYTMKGALVGNENASLDANMHWTSFANSFSADIDIAKFVAGISGTVDPTVYLYKVNNVLTQEYTWEPVNATILSDFHDSSLEKIAPMRAFILNNKGTSAQLNTVDYASMVYAPAMGAAGAPRRRVATSNNTAKLSVMVANEQGAWDKLYLIENDDFSAEYESGRDAEKYMNDDINVYAQADEKQAILATNDLNDTYVGFSTVKGGKFTVSFANVEGRELTLIDHETGAQVAMVEGATYEFTADANTVNDYRFEIVGRANMPTAIDNTEAVKSVKGVYTITGQYVGEMNVWNTLPAGVYVVNGEKRVK